MLKSRNYMTYSEDKVLSLAIYSIEAKCVAEGWKKEKNERNSLYYSELAEKLAI